MRKQGKYSRAACGLLSAAHIFALMQITWFTKELKLALMLSFVHFISNEVLWNEAMSSEQHLCLCVQPLMMSSEHNATIKT